VFAEVFSDHRLFNTVTIMLRRFLGGVLVCLTVGCTAWAQPKVPDGVVYEADVEYGKGGDESLKLDIARPEKVSEAAPCIVVIHGGGWRAGNRKQHVDAILALAKQGYVAATISYRFAPKHAFPAQIEDAKCAVRFLRANAEKYQLDPERIGAVGFSAGAHLSMLLGTMDKDDGMEGEGGHADQSSKVQCVVAFFGPTDFLADDIPEQVVGLVDDLVGATREEKPELRKAASPVTYVSSGDAPTLIYQGTKDVLVPHTQAYKMADALSKAGVPGRVELLLGAGHGWGGAEMMRTLEGTTNFFAAELKNGK
jgi:acetyl esterase/lipase